MSNSRSGHDISTSESSKTTDVTKHHTLVEVELRHNRWKGVCETCEKYERIKPIWSLSFATKDDHSNSLDTFSLDFEKKLHT
ncbi:unnamed protein product [Adineta ricciae]|uniref:Uncharacterized protein n=1 Tax=Adineta ricciae TaxID=249248 RepID=A0A815LVX1_ADIRI|nr:unnamed protein product [Adineta ricciae]